jgi:hypothetical protein
VRDEDHGLAAFGDEGAEQFDDPPRVDRIEGARRLVGEDDRRLGDEGPRDRAPLLLAAGELVGPMAGAVPHADHVERRERGLLGPPLRCAVEHEREGDRLNPVRHSRCPHVAKVDRLLRKRICPM